MSPGYIKPGMLKQSPLTLYVIATATGLALIAGITAIVVKRDHTNLEMTDEMLDAYLHGYKIMAITHARSCWLKNNAEIYDSYKTSVIKLHDALSPELDQLQDDLNAKRFRVAAKYGISETTLGELSPKLQANVTESYADLRNQIGKIVLAHLENFRSDMGRFPQRDDAVGLLKIHYNNSIKDVENLAEEMYWKTVGKKR